MSLRNRRQIIEIRCAAVWRFAINEFEQCYCQSEQLCPNVIFTLRVEIWMSVRELLKMLPSKRVDFGVDFPDFIGQRRKMESAHNPFRDESGSQSQVED